MATEKRIYSINEAHPAFREFWKCYDERASSQYVFNSGALGYGNNYRRIPKTEAEKKIRKQKVLLEFSRMFQHGKNLVEPLEGIFPWNDKQVLDFGCGTGSLSAPLAQHGAFVIGVDPVFQNLRAVN